MFTMDASDLNIVLISDFLESWLVFFSSEKRKFDVN